tara:strand:+ start:1404 stop:2375 length:972 start_codon:yes stop_codon:yes gene_type:complete
MKILITGGAGMVGSNLSKRLIDEGHEITIIDNFWRGSKRNLESLGLKPNQYNLIKADLSEEGPWEEAFKDIECVYHLADIVAGIGYVFSNEGFIFRQNLKINSNVAQACEKQEVKRYVYVGTACSFPLELQLSVDSPPLLEEDQFPANPESAYGWSKLMGELDAKYLSEQGMDTVILVFHNVYGGPCDFSEETGQVIPSLISRALNSKDKNLIVWGDGSQGRAFVNVYDVVQALVSALYKGENSGPIQIGPDNCTSIKTLAEIIVKKIDENITIQYDLSKPTGDKGRCANYGKANKLLLWEPKVKLEDGIEDLIEYIRSERKN